MHGQAKISGPWNVNIVGLPRLQVKITQFEGLADRASHRMLGFYGSLQHSRFSAIGRIRRAEQPATIRRTSKFSISRDVRDASIIQSITITAAIAALAAKVNR